MINWTQAQTRLRNAGYYAGQIDGIAGPKTFAALAGYVAGRKPDPVITQVFADAPSLLSAAGISETAERLGDFLAQTCIESARFTTFEENMRYSAKRIMAVWPSRFPTLASALPYAWDPTDPDREDIALANRVYGGRMGNERNGTNDNDGWDDRGGGMLQHTGFDEYAALRKRLGLTPDQVRSYDHTLAAACDGWTRRNVNAFCDRKDFRGARRAVNGGYIGVDEVAARRNRALAILV